MSLLLAAGSSGSYTLTANAGSYLVTGQTATISRNRVLNCLAGSYSVTGQSVTISKNRVLNVSAGSYAVTGQSATVTKGRQLTAQSGSYLVTGQSVEITRTSTTVIFDGGWIPDKRKRKKRDEEKEYREANEKRREAVRLALDGPEPVVLKVTTTEAMVAKEIDVERVIARATKQLEKIVSTPYDDDEEEVTMLMLLH